jgi:hypothetical protein
VRFGAAVGAAGRGSAADGVVGSGLMILTAGIELAEGKSNLDEPALADPLDAGAPASAGATEVDTPVVSGGPAIGGNDATAGLAPFGCHASACTPRADSKVRAFMLATTRPGSRNSRSSAQSAPVQPRVNSTWATRP